MMADGFPACVRVHRSESAMLCDDSPSVCVCERQLSTPPPPLLLLLLPPLLLPSRLAAGV